MAAFRVSCSLWCCSVSRQVRALEDLPPGALVQLGDNRFRAGGDIQHLASSPDGKQYATVQKTGKDLLAPTVWDADTGRPVREQYANRELFKGMVWSENGAFAIVIRAEAAAEGKPGKIIPDDFRVWNFADPKAEAPSVVYLPDVFERTNGSIDNDQDPPKPQPVHQFPLQYRRSLSRREVGFRRRKVRGSRL